MARKLEIPTQLGRAFTLAQARQHGLSAMQLHRSSVTRPVHGIYLQRDPDSSNHHPARVMRETHLAIARALSSELAEGHCFSHETAALLWNLPVRIHRDSPIRVTSTSANRRMRRRGVQHSILTPALAEVTHRHGMRVTSSTATWAMLAPILHHRDAVALGDAVLHHPRIAGIQRLERDPHATFEELITTINAPYRRHRDRLLHLAGQLTAHSASAPESHLRLMLNDMGFMPEALDLDVWDEDGTFVGCTEIAYPSRRVLVEYEGDHHRTETRQWNRDIEKYARYAALGWVVVRVTAEMLYRRPERLRRQLADLFERRPPVDRGALEAPATR